jgi:histone deacetylase 6
VAKDHACWSDPELEKKVTKKRFGGVKKSDQIGINNMMQRHAPEVQQWILNRVSQSGNSTEDEKMA